MEWWGSLEAISRTLQLQMSFRGCMPTGNHSGVRCITAMCSLRVVRQPVISLPPNPSLALTAVSQLTPCELQEHNFRMPFRVL